MLGMEQSAKTTFSESLDRLFEEQDRDDPEMAIRQKAWDHFQALQLPDRKSEAFRYLRLRDLYSRGYRAAPRVSYPVKIPNDASGSCLVFVNGYFFPELSSLGGLPAGVSVLPLAQALKKFSAFLGTRWLKTLKEEKDPFAALNAALASDSAFLYVPPRCRVEKPIQIYQFYVGGEEPVMMTPRLQSFVGTQAEVTLCQRTIHLSNQGNCVNQVHDFTLDEGAQVHYVDFNHGERSDAWHLEGTRVRLKRDAHFQSVAVTDGALTHRQDYHVMLEGENGLADLNGLWLLKERRQAHTHILVEHRAPYCRSNQLFKGVLTGASHSSFEGKIFVHQAAQKTDAFQLNNNLILDDRAQAYSKPNLEIFADDVKASHGATVGRLDQELLFYLQTRGLLEREAKNLLVKGFAQEVIAKLPWADWQPEEQKLAADFLG